jgi:hypothetical protein
MSFRIAGLDRSRNRPALFMAQNQDQFGAQMLHRILDTTQHGIIDDVSRHPNNEQVSQTLIEQKLGRNPRISAAENHGKRMLSGFQLLPAGHRLIWMSFFVSKVALIARHQSRQRVIGGNRSWQWLLPPGADKSGQEKKTPVVVLHSRLCLCRSVLATRKWIHNLHDRTPVAD